jgi:hypothetical protein
MMIDEIEKLHSCIPYTMQPCNFNGEKCNSACNSNATASLKDLAAEVLRRNQRCNNNATEVKNQCNIHATSERKELPMIIMSKYGISLRELKEFLGEDWNCYKDNSKALIAWADLLSERKLIEQGIVPDGYAATTRCMHCGDIYVPPGLTNNGIVYGCMWCFNRGKGLPIPRPNIDLIKKISTR